MKSTPSHRGFTLIELLISIALGSMVVYVSVAGLRVAAQSVTLGQRLATENAIVRAGVLLALHDADFWTGHDDPFDVDGPGQALRQTTSQGRFQGLPFTPFNRSTVYTRSGNRTAPGQMDAGVSEGATGWDPNAWGAHEARGWSWINLIERTPAMRVPAMSNGLPAKNNDNSQIYTGVFAPNRARGSNVPGDNNRALAKRQIFGAYARVAAPFGQMNTTPSTSSIVQPHRWQQRQLDGLKRSLGPYGLLEYLPANTPLATYSTRYSANNTTYRTWMMSPEWCYNTGSMDGGHLIGDNRSEGFNFAKDTTTLTLGVTFALPNPIQELATTHSPRIRRTLTQLRDIGNRRYGVNGSDRDWNDEAISTFDQLLRETEIRHPILDATSAPLTWASLHVSNQRHVFNGSFVCLSRVAWAHPLTGRQAEFTFTVFGTNLRGARQQRLRDRAGWADPFANDPAARTHLDHY